MNNICINELQNKYTGIKNEQKVYRLTKKMCYFSRQLTVNVSDSLKLQKIYFF